MYTGLHCIERIEHLYAFSVSVSQHRGTRTLLQKSTNSIGRPHVRYRLVLQQTLQRYCQPSIKHPARKPPQLGGAPRLPNKSRTETQSPKLNSDRVKSLERNSLSELVLASALKLHSNLQPVCPTRVWLLAARRATLVGRCCKDGFVDTDAAGTWSHSFGRNQWRGWSEWWSRIFSGRWTRGYATWWRHASMGEGTLPHPFNL